MSDPYGVFPKPLALTEGGLFLLSLLEGKTLEEVQEEVFKAHGVLVPKKELEDLVKGPGGGRPPPHGGGGKEAKRGGRKA